MNLSPKTGGFCALQIVQCGVFLLPKFDQKVLPSPARKYISYDIVSVIRALAGEEGSCPTFQWKKNKSGRSSKIKAAGIERAMKVEKVCWQAMRGSARRASGGAEIPCAPRGLARGHPAPLHPRPRRALLPCGTPASDRFWSDTPDRRVRPFGIRAHGALLPETPASKGCTAPFPHYPS